MAAQARGGSNEEGWSNASAAGENTNKADRETKLGGTSVYTAQEDDRGISAGGAANHMGPVYAGQHGGFSQRDHGPRPRWSAGTGERGAGWVGDGARGQTARHEGSRRVHVAGGALGVQRWEPRVRGRQPHRRLRPEGDNWTASRASRSRRRMHVVFLLILPGGRPQACLRACVASGWT